MTYIAHIREKDREIQSVSEHLLETSEICSVLLGKINLEQTGLIIGLLHDFGKYSQAFQNYIQSAQGLIDPDDVFFVDAKENKGKLIMQLRVLNIFMKRLKIMVVKVKENSVGKY